MGVGVGAACVHDRVRGNSHHHALWCLRETPVQREAGSRRGEGRVAYDAGGSTHCNLGTAWASQSPLSPSALHSE